MRGYPPRYASGKRMRWTLREEASLVVRSRAERVDWVVWRVRDWAIATVREGILAISILRT